MLPLQKINRKCRQLATLPDKITVMKESFLFLAKGFEEIEALTAVDVLRRAGFNLKTVSITSALQVTGAHGITVNADLIYDNTLFSNPSWLILPGGMPGASNLHEYAPLRGLLKRQVEDAEGRIAAICAAPAVILGQQGLLKGRKATCYPGFENLLEGSEISDAPVVYDDKFVLGNGPANALSWALTIVKVEKGAEAASGIAAGMLLFPQKEEPSCNFFG